MSSSVEIAVSSTHLIVVHHRVKVVVRRNTVVVLLSTNITIAQVILLSSKCHWCKIGPAVAPRVRVRWTI
jgi:hypothetical protein